MAVGQSFDRASPARGRGPLWSLALIALGGCSRETGWPGTLERAAYHRAVSAPLAVVPPNHELWFATNETASPALRFAAADATPHAQSELIVEVERPVVLVATCAEAAVLDLPAMRVRRELAASAPGVVWFEAMQPGSYPIELRSANSRWTGSVRVLPAGTRTR